MAFWMPLIAAGASMFAAQQQAQAQKEAQEEAEMQEQNRRIGGYGDKIAAIAEAFGTGEQNKSNAEAEALKRILSGI